MNDGRRNLFTFILLLGTGLDMFSTYAVVILRYGFDESNPLIKFFIQQSPLFLAVWTIAWAAGFYILYPFLKKHDFMIHAEVVAVLMSIASLEAAAGNFLLYFNLVA